MDFIYETDVVDNIGMAGGLLILGTLLIIQISNDEK